MSAAFRQDVCQCLPINPALGRWVHFVEEQLPEVFPDAWNREGTSSTGAPWRAAVSRMTARYGSHALGPAFAFSFPPTSSLFARTTNRTSEPCSLAMPTSDSRLAA